MSDEKAAPKFLQPGDDPELDRLLDEARREGAEPLGEVYYDMFGRLRRTAVGVESATTLGQSERRSRNDKSLSTGPVVTETPPVGRPRKMTQAWVLGLAALGIIGPTIVLTIAALRSGPGLPGKQASQLPERNGAAIPAAFIEPPTLSGGEASMKAPEDRGAAPATTTEPSNVALTPPRPGAKPGSKGPAPRSSAAPYPYPSAKPRKPNPGSDIW